MKKFVFVVLILALFVQPASAKKVQTLKTDANKMTWYLIDYGVDYGTPYAVARKYYTNPSIKQETIEQLESRYGLSRYTASTLYFTEYGWEYSQDGKQVTTTYMVHYDFSGHELYRIDYDDSYESRRRFYSNVTPNTPQSRGYAYAVGKLY